MCTRRRRLKIKWLDEARNDGVLTRIEEKRSLSDKVLKRKRIRLDMF